VTSSDDERAKPHCSSSEYGCCHDNETPALGPHMAGCPRTSS